MLEEFRAEMDKAGIPPKASLVLLVACTGRVPVISDEVLDEFARIGHALAPEKVPRPRPLPQSPPPPPSSRPHVQITRQCCVEPDQ